MKDLTRSACLHIAIAILALGLFAAGCGSSEDSADGSAQTAEDTASQDETTNDDADADADADSGDGDIVVSGEGVDVGLFFDGALAEDATTVDCTLNGGAETTCYSLTIAGYPASHDVGPFCPDTIADDSDAGGIWFDGEGVYDLDGDFIVGLAELYDDDEWQMYDEDGNVLVTETAEEFEAAARPDVDPSLENHCVEGALEWLDNGEPITTTVLIPIVPVAADSTAAPQGSQGITLDGVVIAESAPVDAILSAYTIAAFDDCGGHFNPFEGYHMHGATGCSEVGDAADGETPMFGYALDGYPVHSPLADADLDECNGHTTEAAGYHYHANSAEQNQVISCLVGQSVAGEDAGPAGPPQGE
ncbi:MAG: hypothetical protein DHS20C19_18590 [Acidimicrobiales bacterium]|nr:MAG: hypothetical protein DHS20C19_18590 [Acidimicrobiales bacterium]